MSIAHNTKKRGNWVKWILLIVLILLAEFLKFHPVFIEKYYSNGFYPVFSLLLRTMMGWIPFSAGDLLLGGTIGWLLFRLVRNLSQPKKNISYSAFATQVEKWAGRLVMLYLVFLTVWGFSYYRLGSAYQLHLQPGVYSNEDLARLLDQLQYKLDHITADSSSIEAGKTSNRKMLSDQAMAAYQKAARQYTFLAFRQASLKPMLLGKIQNYTGYAGYLQPFTGEAQVNFYGPAYDLPFTVCHEMAHQLGYGSESEANMIGFLACSNSSDPTAQYSAYSNMQGYALLEMSNRDSVLFRDYRDRTPAILKKDRENAQLFYQAHESLMQPVLNWVYTRYLYSNNQAMGLDSYNYVVAWLIAYGKKYGWQAI